AGARPGWADAVHARLPVLCGTAGRIAGQPSFGGDVLDTIRRLLPSGIDGRREHELFAVVAARPAAPAPPCRHDPSATAAARPRVQPRDGQRMSYEHTVVAVSKSQEAIR